MKQRDKRLMEVVIKDYDIDFKFMLTLIDSVEPEVERRINDVICNYLFHN